MFIDEARIIVASGKGGDGVVHFRREKFVPFGGPDGGDGGKGGDVIFEVSAKLSTLAKFTNKRKYLAADGRRGGRSNKTGAQGSDEIVPVPPGTLVYHDGDNTLIADLTESGERFVICKGGRGGKGNAHFTSSRNQAPRIAERGEPGEDRHLRLELRLLADIGIVGIPNAGKSTLLASVTRARPKIASYPFTTLQPNLGVAQLDEDVYVILADLPGLIEGAHQGIGLGSTFLRHIQRTRVLIHLIDGGAEDPMADFSQLNSELALFDRDLGNKPQIIAINKIDMPEIKESAQNLEKQFQAKGERVFLISALARTNLKPLLWAAHKESVELENSPEISEIPVYRADEDPSDFKITRDLDGAWRVMGKSIERAAAMTYWEYDEAIRRFQKILVHLGIEQALRDAGAQVNDTVRIGDHELEWKD